MGLFDGTPLERPVTCAACEQPLDACRCRRDATGKVLTPQQQTARIRLEKRRKGKTVTTIAGLDPAASDLEAILRTLKRHCGSGGTVSEGTIEVQGDHRSAADTLLAEMGYRVKRT